MKTNGKLPNKKINKKGKNNKKGHINNFGIYVYSTGRRCVKVSQKRIFLTYREATVPRCCPFRSLSKQFLERAVSVAPWLRRAHIPPLWMLCPNIFQFFATQLFDFGTKPKKETIFIRLSGKWKTSTFTFRGLFRISRSWVPL